MRKLSTEEMAQIGQHKDDNSHVIKIANDRLQEALKKHEEFVKKAEKSQNFVMGEQWSEDDRKINEDNGKPVLTINVSLTTVNAIYAEYSKIKADLVTKSIGNNAHDESVLLNKTLRIILLQNGHSETEADFFLDAIISGRAWWDVSISDERDPLGEIVLKIEDYNKVILSTEAADYDPDTWPELFYFDTYTREELEEVFGRKKAEMVDYSILEDKKDYKYLAEVRTFGEGDSEQPDNMDAYDTIPVFTREWYEYTDAFTFVDDATTDYEIYPTTDFESDDDAIKIARENNLTLYKSRMKRIRYIQWVGSLLLEDDWSPQKHYSKMPFFAYFSKGRTMSVMDNVISPQEQLNKAESQELHIINSTSNGGWQMEEDTLVNLTPEQLEKKGSKAGLVIVRRRGAAPLEKIHPNQVPTGISNLGNKSMSHTLRVSGVNEAMIGLTKTNDSGTLFEGKKDVGQGLLQRVFDNLRRSQKYLTRSIIDLVQEYYTEPRILRYAAADGEVPEEVAINQVDAAGRIVNDITVGRYEVMITWAPKADVLNDYELDQYLRMREAGMQIPDWKIVQKSQLSDKEELVAVLRRQAGLDKTPEEMQLEQIMQQIELGKAQLELEQLKADIRKKYAEAAEAEANAEDILIGQNRRHLLDLMGSRESDQVNADLRKVLSDNANDTTIVKQMLQNSQKSQEPQLGKIEEDK